MLISNVDFTFMDMQRKLDELVDTDKVTMLTYGGTEFLHKELNNKKFSINDRVTVALKNGNLIKCDAEIYALGDYGDQTSSIYIKIFNACDKIPVTKIIGIQYKDYRFNVRFHSFTLVKEDGLNSNDVAMTFVVDIIIKTDLTKLIHDNRMASVRMTKMFLGVYQSIARDYMNNISKLEKDLNINYVDHFNSTCSYFRSKWYTMDPDWFNHVDLVKHNFSNKFMTMRNDKYRINAFIASINDVDIIIETDIETNENHLIYKIKFNKLLNDSYGIGLCNMYKTDTLWLRDDGKVKLYLDGDFEERCHVITSGHRIFNLTIYGRRYSISYEKLVAVALDVYNNDMLESYVDIQCNVKSCTGSINKVEQLINNGCVVHGNIYVPHNLEYCDRTSNVTHASLCNCLYKFIGSYDYMVSAYNYEIHDKIRAYIAAGRAYGGLNYKQCKDELLQYLNKNVLSLSELYTDINSI